ncbi:MAG: nitroreductase family protein [Acholeplasmatales bacterium]|nr:nitroreductase family protein [Acholeplasmatales bacterium]
MDEILERRSIRKYDLSKKISKDTLVELCKYAESAPSARNQKSREYVIVTDKELINKLSTIMVGTMILAECDNVIIVVGKDPKTISRPEFQPQDLSAATENILIAAAKKGIGSCWCGVYPIEERIMIINELLGINDGRFAFSIIALGYPKDINEFRDKNKFSEDLVHFNRG